MYRLKPFQIYGVRNILFLLICIQTSYSQSTNKLATNIKKVDSLNKMSFMHLHKNPSKAILKSKKALTILNNVAYKNGAARANLNIGIAYLRQGYYHESMEYLVQSENIYREISDNEGLAAALSEIGLLYKKLRAYKKSIQKYKEAIGYLSLLRLEDKIALIHARIAVVFIQEGNTKLALEYLGNAFDVLRESKNSSGLAEVRYCLSLLYYKEKNFERAVHHINKSLSYYENKNNTYAFSKSKILESKILRKKGNLEACKLSLDISLQNVKNYHLKKLELEVYEELIKYYQLENRSELVVQYIRKQKKLWRELFNYDVVKKIIDLEKDNQNALSNTNEQSMLNQKKDSIIFYIICLLLIAVGAYFLGRKRNKTKGIKDLTQQFEDYKEYVNAEAEKRCLKLKDELEFKNKQIASYAFNYEQKNEIMKSIFNITSNLDDGSLSTSKESKLIKELIKIGKDNLQLDKEWERYKVFFEESQAGFYRKLKSKHKDLKANDLKLCSLIRLNLNVKETANILNVSAGSLKTARYRLRKKLDLNPGEELIDYLIKIEEEEIESEMFLC